MYTTEEFYKNEYQGSLNIRLPFYLQKSTLIMQERITGNAEEIDKDKLSYCCCEIADLIYEEENIKGLSSESNDGWSKSYTHDNNISNDIMDILKIYIPPKYLYRGCY